MLRFLLTTTVVLALALPAAAQDAEVDAFAGTNYSIVPSERATPEAVKTVVGLAEILGAKPMFIDPVEHDSYSAATVRPLGSV